MASNENMTSQTTTANATSYELTTSAFEYDYYDTEYKIFAYPGFTFERPMYIYIWEILVIITSVVNIVVVFVMLRKNMRSQITVVLAAIAISDSLTGLTTLPTYIMVYQSTDLPPEYDNGYEYIGTGGNVTAEYHNGYEYIGTGGNVTAEYHNGYEYIGTGGNVTAEYDNGYEFIETYFLSKELCRWFMATKFFISKSCYTISIYLTLYLGIQRFITAARPLHTRYTFTTKLSIRICIVIAIFSPVLHLYHLFDEKAVQTGLCEWELKETDCKGGCIELWIMFIIRNFLPCGVLLIFTVLFIRELSKSGASLRSVRAPKDLVTSRALEHRRLAWTVTAILIAFLVPEIPYEFFLLHNAIDKTFKDGQNMILTTNRAIHMSYELLLVLSFHSKFYIYLIFYGKFRKSLLECFSSIRQCVRALRSKPRSPKLPSSNTVGIELDSVPLQSHTEVLVPNRDNSMTEASEAL